MRSKGVRVGELATQVGLDVEELIIRLWDAGFEHIDSPKDSLRATDASKVRRALGLPSSAEITRPAYWRQALNVDGDALEAILADAGLQMGSNAATLPKGAVRVLKRQARGIHLVDTPAVPAPPSPKQKEVPPAFEWADIGSVLAHRLLTAEEVESIHWTLAKDFVGDVDPITPAGVREPDLLQSAVYRQHTSSGETLKYPTAVMAAAALLHSLVLNHPFYNGNKRTALVSMLVLLDENGLMLVCDEEHLFRIVLRLAQREIVPREWPEATDREVAWLADWIHDHSRRTEKGERPVQWRRLRQILGDFNSRCDVVSGSKMRISRVDEPVGSFKRLRRRTLSTQVKYTDEGREAQKSTIHQIRRELHLDDEHGVDSASFYGDAGRSVGDFIVRYRKTLNRLAKL